jgi:hypothetical protein
MHKHIRTPRTSHSGSHPRRPPPRQVPASHPRCRPSRLRVRRSRTSCSNPPAAAAREHPTGIRTHRECSAPARPPSCVPPPSARPTTPHAPLASRPAQTQMPRLRPRRRAPPRRAARRQLRGAVSHTRALHTVTHSRAPRGHTFSARKSARPPTRSRKNPAAHTRGRALTGHGKQQLVHRRHRRRRHLSHARPVRVVRKVPSRGDGWRTHKGTHTHAVPS